MNAYEKGLSYLARREHSKKELRDKLQAKGYNKEEIESAIEKLESEGSLSEIRFIEAHIRHAMKTGDSAMKLRAKLLERGCPRSLVDEYVNEYKESIEYYEAIRPVVEKILGEKEEGKALQSLARRGYLPYEINNVKRMR